MRWIECGEIDSTNELAKRYLNDWSLALFGCSEPPPVFGITATRQTMGKGTQGRSWQSPVGGIYMSVVHCASKMDTIPLTTDYTTIAGRACAYALKEQLNLDVMLKPINDLYVDGKKLGGILTETLIHDGQIRALITGVGINTQPVTLSDENPYQAISLSECLPPHQWERFNQDAVVRAVAESITAHYESMMRALN